MKLESIEKLRSFAPIGIGHNDFMKAVNAVENEVEEDYVPRKLARQDAAIKDELATELEELKREISERYMPPPVDADGVPWIKEDETFIDRDGYTWRIHSIEYSFNLCKWLIVGYENGGRNEFLANTCRHVKPDPVKKLLEEFGNTVSKQGVDFDMLDAVDEYATKLREAVSANE